MHTSIIHITSVSMKDCNISIVHPMTTYTIQNSQTTWANPSYHPFHILPIRGNHSRAVSVVQFAPSTLNTATSVSANNDSNPIAICASASADSTIKIWNITQSAFMDDNDIDDDSNDDHDLEDLDRISEEDQEQPKENICPFEGGEMNLTHQSIRRANKQDDQENFYTQPLVTITGPSGVNDLAWSPCDLFPLKSTVNSSHTDRHQQQQHNHHFSKYIATACDDKSIYLWDVHRAFQGGGSNDNVTNGQGGNNSTSSKGIVAGEPSSSGGTWFIRDIKRRDVVAEFKGHSNFCFSVAFHPQGNIIASGSFDETVKLWDIRSGECIMTLPAHADPVTSVDFSNDGSFLISSSHDGLLRIWDVATGSCLKTFYYSNHDDEDDEDLSLLTKEGGNKKNGGKPKEAMKNVNKKAPTTPPIGFAKYSPNGNFVLSSTLDGKLRLTDITKRHGPFDTLSRDVSGKDQLCTKIYTGHTCKKFYGYCDFMTANPKWQGVVTGSEDGMVYIYDLQRRNIQQKLQYDNNGAAIIAVASHPSMELLATGCLDNTVRFWAPKDNP